jgi:hypothetical protein
MQRTFCIQQGQTKCGLTITLPPKEREEWFSLKEDHEKACRIGLTNRVTTGGIHARNRLSG